MEINKFFLMKESDTSATVSLKFEDDEDSEAWITIGGIIIDLDDTASPVRSMKADGQELIRGPIFDYISKSILKDFISLKGEKNGLYIIDDENIERG